MNDEPKRQTRACTMTLTIGADTRADMAEALDQLAIDLINGYINGPSGCSGGTRSGFSYEVKFGDRPTNEEYIAELNAYLERKRHE